MTLVRFLTTGQPDGTTATTGNTGANVTPTGTGGTTTWKTAFGAHGSTGLQQVTTTAGQTNTVRFKFNAQSASGQSTHKQTTPPSNPSSDYQLFQYRYTGGRCFNVVWTSTGQVRVLDSANTITVLANAGVLSNSTQYVWAVVATGNSASTGAATIKVYAVGGTTPLTTANVTGGNFTANLFDAIDFGGGTVVGSHGEVDVQMNDGSGTEIPDYVPTTPLTTPTVTAGTIINPTVVGGSNGTAVATWPAVANATGYDAFKILNPSGTPADADFGTAVATGVTSPYTFTGLSAGNYAIGIKAKA